MIGVCVKFEEYELEPFIINYKPTTTVWQLKYKIAKIIGLADRIDELTFVGFLFTKDQMKICDFIKDLTSWHPTLKCYCIKVLAPKALEENIKVIPDYHEIKKMEPFEVQKSTFINHLYNHYKFVKSSWSHPSVLSVAHIAYTNTQLFENFMRLTNPSTRTPLTEIPQYPRNWREIIRERYQNAVHEVLRFDIRIRLLFVLFFIMSFCIGSMLTANFKKAYLYFLFSFLGLSTIIVLWALRFYYLLLLVRLNHRPRDAHTTNNGGLNANGEPYNYTSMVSRFLSAVAGFFVSLVPNLMD